LPVKFKLFETYSHAAKIGFKTEVAIFMCLSV
jgi:hypothetical protein